MRHINYFLLIPVLFLFACNDDKMDEPQVGDLEINYTLVYDNEPLVMNQTLDYPNDLKINFSRVNMFLSNFFLDDQKVADLTFLDFSDINITETAAASGLTLRLEDIPAGMYSKLTMGIGVPQALNATEPSDYELGHPLAETSEYWAGWDSYIFAKYEGKVDTNRDNTLETGFTFHTGSDAVYRNVTFNESIVINAGQTTELKIVLDAKQLFLLDNEYLNLLEIQGTHNQGDVNVMSEISDNYSTAFTME